MIGILLCASIALGQDPASDGRNVEFFEKNVRPILHQQCVQCHGPEKQKGGLRLDSRAGVMKGGDSGPVLAAGDPDKSLLIKAVRQSDPELMMPPRKTAKKLPDAVIADLAAWVKAGAPFPPDAEPATAKHWAFEPIRDPAPQRSIDGFVTAKSAAVPAADKRTLIRRASYDLTGLPPSPEDVDRFAADAAPDAFARLVDRLLDSPAYGEKWGRKWLDLVRYADTAGENSDFPSPHVWRYRNYVIDSFNRDKPYDQFLREQIAGDLMAKSAPPERVAELITATGYLAVARRFGHDTDHDMHLTIEDVIDTTGKSLLGLTLGCARCHNHKYDPITTRDYYSLYGIFASTRFPFPGCEAKQRPRDLVPLQPSAEVEAALRPQRAELARLDGEVRKLSDELTAKRKSLDTPVKAALGSGELPATGEQTFRPGRIEVKAGDMIQFTLLPRANYGGDSTIVELEIVEQGGENRTWNLTRDLVPDFAAAPKSAWLLFDLVPGPAQFTTFVKDADKTPGLHVWRGAAAQPSAFVNTREETLKFSTVTMPARSLALHPGPNGPVAVAWSSPIDGSVTLQGRVAKADAGGDGVAWRLELRPGIAAALAEQKGIATRLAESKKQRDELFARLPPPEFAYAVAEGKAADVRIQLRGEPDQPGDLAPRRNLDLLGGQKIADAASSGRLDLAAWLTDPANPLTARVMANRIWQGHFGRGIVETPSDFGTRGARPSDPDLLDHLASRFRASGWSIKSLHRLILLSAAWQRASEGAPGTAVSTTGAYSEKSSAAGTRVWFPRRRLDAEEIRDSLLRISGELDPTPGGPHPFPPEDKWGFTQHNPFKAVYDTPRRSVYLMTQRIQRHPFLALFDGADTNASTARRDVSTVPTQALYFMNDSFVHARAEALARRLLALPAEQRVESAHRLCFQRPAAEGERKSAVTFLNACAAEFKNLSPEKRELASWSAYVRTLLGSNEFIYVD